MRAARFALPLAALLVGAAPAPTGKTLQFAPNADGTRWCGYPSVKAAKAAMGDAMIGETGAITYVSGRMTRLIHVISPESGDWLVTDTYSFSGNLVRVERQIGVAEGGIQAIKRGAAPKGRPIRLTLISARYPDGRPAKLGDYYDPNPEVVSNVDAFPFVGLGKTMLRRGLNRLCTPAGKGAR